jgi:hypothetical protein
MTHKAPIVVAFSSATPHDRRVDDTVDRDAIVFCDLTPSHRSERSRGSALTTGQRGDVLMRRGNESECRP